MKKPTESPLSETQEVIEIATKSVKNQILHHLKLFTIGVTFVGFFILFGLTTLMVLYENQYNGRIYQGVKVDGVSFSLKTKTDVENYFAARNHSSDDIVFDFTSDTTSASFSAREVGLGIDAKLLAEQAYSIGRTGNIFADTMNKITAWFGGIDLPVSYTVNRDLLDQKLSSAASQIFVAPSDASLIIENNRVKDLHPEVEGKGVDREAITSLLLQKAPQLESTSSSILSFPLPIRTVDPQKTLATTNTLGINTLLGRGDSLYAGSIPNRVFNVSHATEKVNGVIIPPGGVFSFNDVVGDISKATGFKEGYIIKDGRTVLGDGGGVCQVSTTLFRAVLNAGLPVIERHAHAYRVHYYEEDALPGLDATVFSPTYDFRFKNDTPASIAIVGYADDANTKMYFEIYGTSDGRVSQVSKPVFTSQSPAPPDAYQDDPTLPKGVIKQVDFAAPGAVTVFTRKVTRDGKELINETYKSNYRPWQAIFLRGTM